MTSASPVFIKSQMPRMHCQNLLTGQWYHRDVQGVNSPNITWTLNAANTFTCTLSPPRTDMMDSSGNPLLQEWRDAVYLEENDEIKFGGIVTSSSISGATWQLTVTGFMTYPTGMIYEGANITEYNVDALDAVRGIWSWLQAQPNSNLNLDLGTQKSGVLLGSTVTGGASTTVARPVKKGDVNFWVWGASGFSTGDRITVGGHPYTIARVGTTPAGVVSGLIWIWLPPALGTTTNQLHGFQEAHAAGEQVLQTTSIARFARNANNGDVNIWLTDSGGFTSGETILIDSTQVYVIATILTNTNGTPTGEVTLTAGLRQGYKAGTYVIQAPTPYQLLWYNNVDCGSEIQSIQAEAIFDMQEVHTWSSMAKTDVHHQLQFGVPRLGSHRSDLRFVEGENVVQAVQVTRDGTKYANNIVGLGAGSGTAQLRSTASALGGRLRRTSVYNDQTAFTLARVSSEAQKQLAAMQNIDAPAQVVVKNHPHAPFGSFIPGDDIPVTMCTGWRNVTIWCRITAMSQDPTTDLMTLTVARSDSFSYMAQSGQAGTI